MMGIEIYCEDCKEFVKLDIFSRNHKKHEMKMLPDLLEERKKECYKILEVQKNNIPLNSFDESDKKVAEIKAQCSEMKACISDQSDTLKTQIDCTNILLCKTIDNQLSKIEKNYTDFKENFIVSENKKLLDIEKMIENLDIKSLDKLNGIFPSMPKMYEAELELCLQEASGSFNAQQYLPSIIPTVTATPNNYCEPKDLDSSKVAPVLAVLPNSEKKHQATSTPNLSFTVTGQRWYHDALEQAILVTQDLMCSYALYKSRISIYSKDFECLLRHLNLDFEPFDIVFVGKVCFMIDFGQKYLYMINEDDTINKIVINTLPNSLSVDKGKGVIIAGDNNAISYNPSTKQLLVIPKTSSIGRVLMFWRVDSKDVLMIANNGKNLLLRRKNRVVINKFKINLDMEENEFLININDEGRICILQYHDKTITILDSNFDIMCCLNTIKLSMRDIKYIEFHNNFINFTLMASKTEWKGVQYEVDLKRKN